MELTPIRRNTVALTTLAMIAALGIVVRVFIHIPLIFGVVDLTPGFLFSLLGGVIGGLPGGILDGAITGLGGAMAFTEPPLLPMIGNICLGCWIILSARKRIVKRHPNAGYSSELWVTWGGLASAIPSRFKTPAMQFTKGS